MHQDRIPHVLIEMFQSVGNLEEAAKAYIAQHIQKQMLHKKDIFLQQGAICKSILFVEKGLLRSYFNDGDKAITNWFMQENQLVISVNSFFTQSPAEESVQAIEDCTVWSLRYEHYQYLYTHFHSFCLISLQLTERYYMLSEERLRIMRQKDAEARYRYLLQLNPAIMNRAPLAHIASYLGITQETLSRLRAKRI